MALKFFCFALEKTFYVTSNEEEVFFKIEGQNFFFQIYFQDTLDLFSKIIQIFCFYTEETNDSLTTKSIFIKNDTGCLYFLCQNENNLKTIEFSTDNCLNKLNLNLKNFFEFAKCLPFCIINSLPMSQNEKLFLLANLQKLNFENKHCEDNFKLILNSDIQISHFKFMSLIIFYSDYIEISRRLQELEIS